MLILAASLIASLPLSLRITFKISFLFNKDPVVLSSASYKSFSFAFFICQLITSFFFSFTWSHSKSHLTLSSILSEQIPSRFHFSPHFCIFIVHSLFRLIRIINSHSRRVAGHGEMFYISMPTYQCDREQPSYAPDSSINPSAKSTTDGSGSSFSLTKQSFFSSQNSLSPICTLNESRSRFSYNFIELFDHLIPFFSFHQNCFFNHFHGLVYYDSIPK